MQRFVFFFNDTATTEIYTLSLHDALPICRVSSSRGTRRHRHASRPASGRTGTPLGTDRTRKPTCSDRKSTRLNSSHANISYAVFCLKKKNIVSSKSQLIH